MIKAVIFDVDDTLIVTGRRTVQGLVEISKKIGLRVPTEREVARLLGLPWETMVKTLWPNVNLEDFIQSYEKYKTIHYPLECVVGAKEALDKVKSEGYLVGIITSRNNDTLGKVMEKCGIDLEMFDYIEANDQNRYSKPDPRVFDNLKKKLTEKDIGLEEIVYVGDAIYDYLSASGAGLHFIAFLNGAYSKEEFMEEGLDEKLTVEKLSDLPQILDKIGVEETA